MSWLFTLSAEAGAVLIGAGVILIFAALVWIFEYFDNRHAEHYEARAQQDAERLIAGANSDLFQRPRVRAGSEIIYKERGEL